MVYHFLILLFWKVHHGKQF